MTWPLIILAFFSSVAGFFGLRKVMSEAVHVPNFIEHFLSPSVQDKESVLSASTEWVLMGVTLAILVAVIFYAYNVFVNNKTVPVEDKEMTGFPKLVYNKFFVDDIYNTVIEKPLNMASGFFNTFFETKIVDGLVNGFGKLTYRASSILRLAQAGKVDGYFFAMLVFVLALLIFKLF